MNSIFSLKLNNHIKNKTFSCADNKAKLSGEVLTKLCGLLLSNFWLRVYVYVWEKGAKI